MKHWSHRAQDSKLRIAERSRILHYTNCPGTCLCPLAYVPVSIQVRPGART